MGTISIKRTASAVSNLQKISPSKSAWRFVKATFALSAPKPAYRHVLITLASYADEDGHCFPSHDRLLLDTGYTSKCTVVAALAFWKKAGVLTWSKGWGNSHGRRSNHYRFNYEAMVALIKNNHSEGEEQPLRADEQPLAHDERPLTQDEQTLEGQRTTTVLNTKVLPFEGPSNKNVPGNGTLAGGQFSNKMETGQNESATQAQATRQTISAHSSEQPPRGLSSLVKLADVFAQLTPENQKMWYRRTGGDSGPDAVRIAIEILATQGGK